MLLSLSGLNAQRLPAPLPVWHASTDALGWAQVARAAAESGARLVSMWGVDRHACEAGAAGHVACAAFALPENVGKGAIRVDGKMAELLHLDQAQRLLAVAAVISADT